MEEKNYFFRIIDLLRTIINEKTEKIDDSFLEKVSEYLKLEKKSDWHTFCCIMDSIEDTEHAKLSFKKYGFKGPTQYEDLGEIYIRLYGFFNALYLQKTAIEELLRISRIENIAKMKKDLNALEIIKLRHKAASHTIKYNDNNISESYMICQYYLENNDLELLDQNNKFEEYSFEKLKNLLEEYNNYCFEVLCKIGKKFIEHLYKTESDRKKKFIKEIDELNNEKNGEIVTKIKLDCPFKNKCDKYQKHYASQ